jgi:hypothetical protein
MILGSYFVGLCLVMLTAVLSVIGLIVVRRWIGLETLSTWHEVAGYLLSVVGTMYAVLLGLIVVDAMQKFQDARVNTEQEANALADIYILARRMPPEYRIPIQKTCSDYANLVLNQEWPAMENQKQNHEARHTVVRLAKAVQDFEPRTESEKAIYPMIISEALALMDSRRTRIVTATNGIPAVEWAVVVIGGAVTIVFTYFFGLPSAKSQIVMTSMIAILIALNVYLILLFGYPFSGDLKVTPDGFEMDKKIFQGQIGFTDWRNSAVG